MTRVHQDDVAATLAEAIVLLRSKGLAKTASHLANQFDQQTKSTDASAICRMIQLHCRRGDAAVASSYLDHLRTIDSDHVLIPLFEGDLALARMDAKSALLHYQTILRRLPHSRPLIAYLHSKILKAAVDDLNSAVKAESLRADVFMSALRMVFPYSAYRSACPGTSALSDQQVWDHFLARIQSSPRPKQVITDVAETNHEHSQLANHNSEEYLPILHSLISFPRNILLQAFPEIEMILNSLSDASDVNLDCNSRETINILDLMSLLIREHNHSRRVQARVIQELNQARLEIADLRRSLDPANRETDIPRS